MFLETGWAHSLLAGGTSGATETVISPLMAVHKAALSSKTLLYRIK